MYRSDIDLKQVPRHVVLETEHKTGKMPITEHSFVCLVMGAVLSSQITEHSVKINNNNALPSLCAQCLVISIESVIIIIERIRALLSLDGMFSGVSRFRARSGITEHSRNLFKKIIIGIRV